MSRSRRFAEKVLNLTPVMVLALALAVLTGCGESFDHGHKLRYGVESQDGKVVGYTELVPEMLDLTGYTSIGAHAFRNCRKLRSVKISGGLTGIGEGAFEGCRNSLFDMTKIPGVKLLDGWAVGFTDSLSGNVDLSEVRGIADGAFARCKTLTDVVIGDKVTRLGAGAFAECSRLRNVTIGRGVKQLNGDEFAGCTMIAKFSVSEDNPTYKSFSGLLLTKDGSTLVCGISGDVTIPDGVTRIGKGAFQDYGGLTSVTIPNSVKVIEAGAFVRCAGLTSVTIPDDVEIVEDGAFNSCDGLTNVVVGSGVRNLGSGAFLKCRKIESFSVSKENPHFKSVSGMLLTKDGKSLVCGVNGDVAIPDGVESIAQEAFRDRSGLTSVAIPDHVKTIGNLAFADCDGLTRVVIGKGVQNIHKGVFLNCRKIESFSVSEENLRYKSVSGMLLTKDGMVLVCGVNGDVVVPKGVTRIAQEAFSNCDGLTSVTIPDGVRIIEALAFCDCRELTRVVIGKDVTKIEKDAFYNCRKVGDVSVSEENPRYKSVSGALMTKDGKTLICGAVRADGKGDGNPLTRTFVCISLAFLLMAAVGVAWWAIWKARKNRAA